MQTFVLRGGRMEFNNILVRLIGYKATVLHSDTMVYDRWKWLKSHIIKGPVKTLEAGCGSGAFTMYAGLVGNNATGISFDTENNKKARERVRILKIKNTNFIDGDLRKLKETGNEIEMFDQIICFEVIEHIIEDRIFIKNISHILKPGGVILFTAPNKDMKPMIGDKISAIEDGGHVRWGYSHQELEEIFENAGIEITKKEYVSGFISQKLTNIYRKISNINKRLSWILIFPFRVLVIFDKYVTKLLKYPYFLVCVVGVKRRK